MDKNTNELHWKKTKKVYFPNLNGVRALAALMVVIAHIELHKIIFHVRRIPDINLLNLGKIGVTVFFSLSGFLITYLLLEEKRTFTHVNFKGFYMRRLLRIWPLYFLVVLFGFLLYPVGSKHAIWLSVLFLPNLAFSLNLLPAIVDPIWSIGTEEQFYLFHPHFFRFKKTEHILYALLIFIVIIYAIELGIGKLASANSVYLAFRNLMYYARFDNMMIGAIVAIIYNNTKYPQFKFRFQKLFDAVFKKWFQIVLIIVFIVYLLFYLSFDIGHGDILISVMASLLIVNLCETDTSIYSLQHKYLDYIGQISYGIYLLHKFCLFFVLYLIQKYLPGRNMILENLIIYGTTITGVIGVASLSYYGYEKPFLQIKKRFQKITQ